MSLALFYWEVFMNRHLAIFIRLSLLTTAAVLLTVAAASRLQAEGIVNSIVKAPIVADGNVAGADTDLVINFDISLDPTVNGRSLLAGNSIKIVLPEQFVQKDPPLPVTNVNRADREDGFLCQSPISGANFQCSTGVLLQGWPQHAISPATYELSLEDPNTIVYTASQDLGPGTDPGIKQMHVILKGFTNPAAGTYPIQVIAETGLGGSEETGSFDLEILAAIAPSINVTSALSGVAGNPNTIYQSTSPGELVPLKYDFLLWDGEGNPYVDVDIAATGDDHAFTLMQGGQEVGDVFINTPPGATGFELTTAGPSTMINSPVSALPTGNLTAFFKAGSVAGDYDVTLSFDGGTSVQMFVTVVPEPGSFGLAALAVTCWGLTRRRKANC
jgi:hypothetical protein